MEIVGAALFGAVGSLVGGYGTPSDATVFWQNAYPIIGGAIGVIAGFVIVFILIFLCNLFRAPYRQRNEARIFCQELQLEKEPVLEIVEVKEANYLQMGQTHGLVITNKGTDRADDCRGQLIEIEFANLEGGLSLYRYPVNQPLAWGEQEGDWETKKPFTISGKDSKVLQVTQKLLVVKG